MRQNYYGKLPGKNSLDGQEYFTDRQGFYADGYYMTMTGTIWQYYGLDPRTQHREVMAADNDPIIPDLKNQPLRKHRRGRHLQTIHFQASMEATLLPADIHGDTSHNLLLPGWAVSISGLPSPRC